MPRSEGVTADNDRVQMTIWLSRSMKERVQALAARNHRKVSGQVELMFERFFESSEDAPHQVDQA